MQEREQAAYGRRVKKGTGGKKGLEGKKKERVEFGEEGENDVSDSFSVAKLRNGELQFWNNSN